MGLTKWGALKKYVLYLLHQLYLSLVIVCLNKFSYSIFSKKGARVNYIHMNLIFCIGYN
jgi:hypothetical protein